VTFAGDQQIDTSKLSATAKRILELREIVINEWEKRVRAAFKEARELREPVFIDTIPAFYANIVEALSPDYPRMSATDGVTLASSHGEERARMTNYDPELLILEYQIFRQTFLELLEQNNVSLTTKELSIFNISVDTAIREAVTAFSAVVSSQREQFIAALTHDMRTPLGSASLAAELITHIDNPVRMKELAQKILYNLRRIDHMVQEMLDTMVFQTGQKLKLEISHFDVLDVIREVQQDASSADSSRCEVIGKPVYGWWGREALKRAIENLVGNALKYGAHNRPIRIMVAESRGNLLLSVHNEGAPIPMEDQLGVFEAFKRSQQAKQSRKQGWGVGLPFVRAVAESHGGTIVLDSAQERGTTFTMTIPKDSRPSQDTS
jgi:signal transduction histidine kinase